MAAAAAMGGGAAEALRRVDPELRAKFDRYGVGAAGGKALSEAGRSCDARCGRTAGRRRPPARCRTFAADCAGFKYLVKSSPGLSFTDEELTRMFAGMASGGDVSVAAKAKIDYVAFVGGLRAVARGLYADAPGARIRWARRRDARMRRGRRDNTGVRAQSPPSGGPSRARAHVHTRGRGRPSEADGRRAVSACTPSALRPTSPRR